MKLRVRLTIAEIGNVSNHITMMVDDRCDNYLSLESCLTPGQANRLTQFEATCGLGWYSTSGPRNCKIWAKAIEDQTQDEAGRFCTGYRVYKIGNSYLVQYLTNIQGDRDALYVTDKWDNDVRDWYLNERTLIWMGDIIR